MKIVTAAQMRNLDQSAIQEYNIPGIVLMENAGRGTVDFLRKQLGNPAGKSVIICVGPGNNGGDGLVIARYLHQLGAYPALFFLIDPVKFKGDAALNYRIVRELPIPVSLVDDRAKVSAIETEWLSLHAKHPVWAIIDSLFGTGLTREINGHFLDCINLINSTHETLSVAVAAVDIPSGISSDDGQILGAAVVADYTATYGLAKPGHFLQQGAEHSGILKVIDISIPPAAVKSARISTELLDSDAITGMLKTRSMISHKGSHGHLLILAGSTGKTGAAILCASGAMRCGTGLVTLAVPNTLNPVFETCLSEAMTIPLPNSATELSIDDYDLILKSAKGKTGIVIGPGLGTQEKTRQLVIKLYQNIPLPMILDADGLNILAARPEILRKKTLAPRIFTPHPGEMSRLTGLSTQEVQKDRLHVSSWFAQSLLDNNQAEIFTVLKGAGTIVCNPSGQKAINVTGNSGMASGGMGDVLAGLIAGLVAQGYSPWDACRIGVYVHGEAADRIAESERLGYLASEVADMVPSIMTELYQ